MRIHADPDADPCGSGYGSGFETLNTTHQS
jgi:hypothetical protein